MWSRFFLIKKCLNRTQRKGRSDDIKLKELREEKNLSQKEIAKILNVSISYYSKIESGWQNPSFDFLVKLKNCFPTVNIDVMFFDKTKR